MLRMLCKKCGTVSGTFFVGKEWWIPSGQAFAIALMERPSGLVILMVSGNPLRVRVSYKKPVLMRKWRDS